MSRMHREGVVDYGYGASVARRERLLAAAAPAVRARVLGLAPTHAETCAAHNIEVDLGTGLRTIERGVSSGQLERLQAEVRALAWECREVRSELEELREQRDELAPRGSRMRIARVAHCFVEQLERAGYRIDREPVTVAHLQSERRSLEWAQPRMVAMWLCASIVRRALLAEVGDFFERDFTTVGYARRQVPRLLAELPLLRTAALATCVALGAEPPALLRD